jgi:hypothetical protein
MLLAVDFDEDLVDVEGITVSRDSDTPFGKQIFNVPMTEIEPIVEPDGVGDDIWGESVACICIHPPILAISAS